MITIGTLNLGRDDDRNLPYLVILVYTNTFTQIAHRHALCCTRRTCKPSFTTKPYCSGGDHDRKAAYSGPTPADVNGKNSRNTNKSRETPKAARSEDYRSCCRGGPTRLGSISGTVSPHVLNIFANHVLSAMADLIH